MQSAAADSVVLGDILIASALTNFSLHSVIAAVDLIWGKVFEIDP